MGSERRGQPPAREERALDDARRHKGQAPLSLAAHPGECKENPILKVRPTFNTSTAPAYKVGDDEATSISFASDSFGAGALTASASAANGWAAVSSTDVPEPTSGLLMLLGVAGLALRRKRA